MGRELRREPRVKTSFDVEVETEGRLLHYLTRNASFRGLFLITDQPLPLRRLVRVRCNVAGSHLELIGLVAHTVNSTDAGELGKQPGMGVNLFSLGPTQRELWEDFVRTEYEKDPTAHASLVSYELPRLSINLKNDKMKRQFFDADLPRGDIFYRTPEMMPSGTRVVVEIKHPDTNKVHELFATVADAVDGARRKRGIRIAFDELSEEAANALARFDAGDASEVDG